MAFALAFVDFSDMAVDVVEMARKCSLAFELKLVLMHISTPDIDAEGSELRTNVSREGVAAEMHDYHRQLDQMAIACRKQGVQTTALLVRGKSVRGNPVPKMIRELRRIKPDLVIMGTRQHGRFFDALFGGACSKMIRKVACPILLVPGADQNGGRIDC